MRLVPLLLVSAAALSFNGCRQPVKPQPAPAPAPTRPANGAPAPTPGTPTPNSPAPGGSGNGGAQPGGGGAPGGGANAGGATPAPRAYATVITPRAKSKTGIFGVHMVGTSLFFEIPASEMGKDFVAVSTLAATPAGIGINGTLLDDRLVRFERRENRVYMKLINYNTVATDSLRTGSRAMSLIEFYPIIAVFNVETNGLRSR